MKHNAGIVPHDDEGVGEDAKMARTVLSNGFVENVSTYDSLESVEYFEDASDSSWSLISRYTSSGKISYIALFIRPRRPGSRVDHFLRPVRP